MSWISTLLFYSEKYSKAIENIKLQIFDHITDYGKSPHMPCILLAKNLIYPPIVFDIKMTVCSPNLSQPVTGLSGTGMPLQLHSRLNQEDQKFKAYMYYRAT